MFFSFFFIHILFHPRKDSSLAFMWFFFILPAQCLFWLIYALGIGGFTWCVSSLHLSSFPFSPSSQFLLYFLSSFSFHSFLSTSSGFISGAGLLQYAAGKVIGGIWIAMGFLWLIPIPAAAFLVFIVSSPTQSHT